MLLNSLKEQSGGGLVEGQDLEMEYSKEQKADGNYAMEGDQETPKSVNLLAKPTARGKAVDSEEEPTRQGILHFLISWFPYVCFCGAEGQTQWYAVHSHFCQFKSGYGLQWYFAHFAPTYLFISLHTPMVWKSLCITASTNCPHKWITTSFSIFPTFAIHLALRSCLVCNCLILRPKACISSHWQLTFIVTGTKMLPDLQNVNISE